MQCIEHRPELPVLNENSIPPHMYNAKASAISLRLALEKARKLSHSQDPAQRIFMNFSQRDGYIRFEAKETSLFGRLWQRLFVRSLSLTRICQMNTAIVNTALEAGDDNTKDMIVVTDYIEKILAHIIKMRMISTKGNSLIQFAGRGVKPLLKSLHEKVSYFDAKECLLKMYENLPLSIKPQIVDRADQIFQCSARSDLISNLVNELFTHVPKSRSDMEAFLKELHPLSQNGNLLATRLLDKISMSVFFLRNRFFRFVITSPSAIVSPPLPVAKNERGTPHKVLGLAASVCRIARAVLIVTSHLLGLNFD